MSSDTTDLVPAGQPQDNVREAALIRQAVAVGTNSGYAVAVGDETKEEWLRSEELSPVSLKEMR